MERITNFFYDWYSIMCLCVCVCVCVCVCAHACKPSRSVVSDSLQPMDSNLPGFSWISLVRILELVAISSSRGSSLSKDQTYISWIGRWTLYQVYHLQRPFICVYACAYVCVYMYRYMHTSTHVSSLFIYWWALRWRGLRAKNSQL